MSNNLNGVINDQNCEYKPANISQSFPTLFRFLDQISFPLSLLPFLPPSLPPCSEPNAKTYFRSSSARIIQTDIAHFLTFLTLRTLLSLCLAIIRSSKRCSLVEHWERWKYIFFLLNANKEKYRKIDKLIPCIENIKTLQKCPLEETGIKLSTEYNVNF